MKTSREDRVRLLILAGRDKLREAMKESDFLKDDKVCATLKSSLISVECALFILKAQPVCHHD